MRHRVVGKKLNRDTDHRQSLLKNLASSLILNGKIETSVTKAKFVKPFVEKLITKAKDGSFNSLRILRSRLGNEEALRKLISQVAVDFKDRNGGYTRIKRLGLIRKGDNSEMAIIELVKDEKPTKEKKVSKTSVKKKEISKEVKEEKVEASNEEVINDVPEILPEESNSVEEEK